MNLDATETEENVRRVDMNSNNISWGYHGGIMGISWGYHGDIMGISWGYHGDIMGISWDFNEISWEYANNSKSN
jgi:hypothetical protein